MTETVFLSGLLTVGVMLLMQRLATLEHRLNRLSCLDAKVDVLLQQSGITFDEFHDVPADVREAIERGEYIGAIRLFRQATGAGLREARDVVDEIKRRGPARHLANHGRHG